MLSDFLKKNITSQASYVEYGYGFTNRFFSMGIFAATRNEKFDGIGCRFSFEIFRDW